MGRKEDGASGHMQNPVFEELKACYICKISKKTPNQTQTQECFCILGSSQCSRVPGAWAGPAIAPPAASGEKIGTGWVLVHPTTGCAAGIPTSSQCPPPSPWQRQGEELVRSGVCLGLVCLGGVWVLPPSHCYFVRFVCFFGVFLAGGIPCATRVRVSAGLQSTPDELPSPHVETGPPCLGACLCREELPCISPNFLHSAEVLLTPQWKGTKPCCGRALGAGQGKRGFCNFELSP